MRLKGLRVAIYARYSTDKQNPRSIEDQVRIGREAVAAEGGTVAYVFADAAISGTIAKRDGIAQIERVVSEKLVDAVWTEDVSRLGRNQVQTLTLIEKLRTHGARLIACDGYDSGADARTAMVMGTIKTMMGELYLGELRERTRRGMRGLFEQGLSTGGRIYGYRSVAAGEHKRLAPDEAEAAIVRRIFAEHIAGRSQRSIALALNADGIPSARGGKWGPVTVRELVRNERYRGVIVFGQREWKRGGDGKRKAVLRPRSEWKRAEAAELRIIDDATWHAAQARAGEVERRHASGARPKVSGAYPLSGLLSCSACGALMIVVGGGRYYACGAHHRGEGCANGASLRERAVRAWLCNQIADRIGAPSVLDSLRRGFARGVGDHDRSLRSELTERRAALGRTEAGLDRLYKLVADRGDTPSSLAAIKEREDHADLQRGAIAAIEAQLGRVPVLPSSTAITDFLRKLPDVLDRRPQAGRELLSRLLDGRAACTPPERRGEAYRVRARLKPSEVLVCTAQALTGAVYSSGGCGGAVFALEYAPALDLDGLVPGNYGA